MTRPILPPGAPFPRRIGVVMLTALGDAVHVLPVLDALKRHRPGSHVTWVLQGGPASLVQGHPCVDETVLFRRHEGIAAYLEVRRQLAARPFDLVLGLQTYLKAGIITGLTRAPIKLGFDRSRSRDLNGLFVTHRIPTGPERHIQDQYLEFLDALDVPHGEPVWHLGPTADERAQALAKVAHAEGPVVGFVLATSKPNKNWIPARWGELAARLTRDHGATSVLLGGGSPPERAVQQAVLARSDARAIDTVGGGLRLLLGLLAVCDVVVAPDTGPFHMCVAMNVPAVGLYGYTNPKRVGPYRRFTDLLVDAYGDPGEDYPASREYRMGRMERITVEDVAAKVALALERYALPPWRRLRPA